MEDNNLQYTWIAIPSKISLGKDTLFSPKSPSTDRKSVEDKVNEHCIALTLSQKCADWFLLKMLDSGTVASKMFHKAKSETQPFSHQVLLDTFIECLNGWFS